MNNLEVGAIYIVASLSFCFQDARNWRRHAQPWGVRDWLWAMTHGLMLCLSSALFVVLATHPAYIQPAPTLLSWVAGFILAMAILVLLDLLVPLAVNMGRRIRRLGN